MYNKKKVYEKPELKAVKMLEVGAAAAACCRSNSCSQPTRKSLHKQRPRRAS